MDRRDRARSCKKKKKQVIAIGKKTGCDVELHPVEIIYNTPSILLFCRYANALRTLPDPLGRQHLKRSRRGAVLFVQHHLLDSVVGRRLGRLGVEISKIGQFFDHLNFEKYEPGCLYVEPIFG